MGFINRFSFSFASMFIYLVLLSISMGVIASPESTTVIVYSGILIGWKGALILPFASFLLDKFLMGRFFENSRFWAGIWKWIMVYGLLGWLIALILYGNEFFFVVSGVFTSVIFVVIMQIIREIGRYQQKKLDEMSGQSNDHF